MKALVLSAAIFGFLAASPVRAEVQEFTVPLGEMEPHSELAWRTGTLARSSLNSVLDIVASGEFEAITFSVTVSADCEARSNAIQGMLTAGAIETEAEMLGIAETDFRYGVIKAKRGCRGTLDFTRDALALIDAESPVWRFYIGQLVEDGGVEIDLESMGSLELQVRIM